MSQRYFLEESRKCYLLCQIHFQSRCLPQSILLSHIKIKQLQFQPSRQYYHSEVSVRPVHPSTRRAIQLVPLCCPSAFSQLYNMPMHITKHSCLGCYELALIWDILTCAFRHGSLQNVCHPSLLSEALGLAPPFPLVLPSLLLIDKLWRVQGLG